MSSLKMGSSFAQTIPCYSSSPRLRRGFVGAGDLRKGYYPATTARSGIGKRAERALARPILQGRGSHFGQKRKQGLRRSRCISDGKTFANYSPICMQPQKKIAQRKPDPLDKANLEIRKHLPSVPLLNHLAPPEGWELDRALCASYSAHTSVLCAMLLAMINRSKDNAKGSRVALVRAMRALRGRVHFLIQEGRIAAPRSLEAIPGLLDRFVVPMRYNEAGQTGRSWHPKVCLLRYRPVDNNIRKRGEPSFLWRLWLGSRNFTKDDSWDLALFLSSSAGTNGSTVPGVRNVGETLAQAAGMHAAWAPSLSELDGLTWDVPHGIKIKEIDLRMERGNARRLPTFPAFPDRLIATAPFLDITTLKTLASSTGSADRALISTRPSLETISKNNRDLLEEYPQLYGLSPVSEDALDVEDTDSGEHDQDPEARGLHAKFIWAQYKDRNILYLGSPNLTQRGWRSNAEIHALVETSRDAAAAVALAEGFDAFKQRCHRIELDSLKLAPTTTTAQDTLEEFRKEVAAHMLLRQYRQASGEVVVGAQVMPKFPPDVHLYVGRMSEPRTLWPAAASEVRLSKAKLENESELLHLELTCGRLSVHWLQSAAFDGGLPDARDDAMVASYLGLSGLLDLFADELEPHGLTDVDRHQWDHTPTQKERQREKSRLLGFSIESVMTAWRRAGKSGPEVVQRASKVLELASAHAAATESDRAALRQLQSLLSSWGAIRTALGRGKR